MGQQNYCDFEGNNVISFGICTGILDSLTSNPAPNDVDSSSYCARYIRDTALYDVIKIYPNSKLVDISPFADTSAQAPKMQMKLYCNAPIGTQIILQLGIKSVNDYPSGIHSLYAASTSVQNAWETLTFYYFETLGGTFALPTEIDKVVLLFRPNTSGRDTIYFDDLTGPVLFNSTEVSTNGDSAPLKLSQNFPNPAAQNTVINFQLNSSGDVSLELFDMLGNSVSTLLNEKMKTGSYSIPVETSTLANGIYFYVLKKEGNVISRKMIVSK